MKKYKNHFLYSLTINIDETINNTDKIIKIISEVKAIGTNLITLNIINSSFGEDFFKIRTIPLFFVSKISLKKTAN